MKKSEKLKGVFTAIVSPMKNGKIDFQSFEKLIKAQLAGGIQGFVINGTTGENPTLREDEIAELFKFAKKIVPEDIVLILGTGSNSTDHALHLTLMAEKLGADFALTVVPYYNKPPQRGILQHYEFIADRVNIPIILYNVPSRTITSMDVETVLQLSKHKNIVGIKEATGNMEVAKEIRKKSNPDFVLLSGDDASYVDFLQAGGDGVISVASHVIPDEFTAWTLLAKSGKAEIAKARLEKFRPLIDLLFCEANPIPVKMALKQMGLLESAELRLPLVELGAPLAEKLKLELKRVELI